MQSYVLETMNGNPIRSSKGVVFRVLPGGLSNNVMGLLSAIAVAIAMDYPIFCKTADCIVNYS